jgi:hypothetical protein
VHRRRSGHGRDFRGSLKETLLRGHFLRQIRRYRWPMCSMPEITLTEGRGVEGDRYSLALEAGFYSHKPEAGRQVTLFEIETLWALRRDHDIELCPGRTPAQPHRRGRAPDSSGRASLLARRNAAGSYAPVDPVPPHRGNHGEGDFQTFDQPLRTELPDSCAAALFACAIPYALTEHCYARRLRSR